MMTDTHSLVEMFEGTFGDIQGCIALIDEEGIALYSSSGCGDVDQFQAVVSVLIKNIQDAQNRLSSIDPLTLRQATFETEELAFHIREVSQDIYLIVRTMRDVYYGKIKETLDKFLMTWSAIAVLQEAGIE